MLDQLPTLACCAILTACVAAPSQERASATYVDAQKQYALELEAEHELSLSLAVWRSILPLVPNDEETKTAINQLEKTIIRRSQAAVLKGHSAYAEKRNDEGDLWMLRALALQPNNEDALEALKISASLKAKLKATEPPQRLQEPTGPET